MIRNSIGNPFPMWILWSLASALFSAVCAILQKKALFEQDPFAFSLALYAIEAIVFVAVFCIADCNGLAALGVADVGMIYIKSIFNVLSFVLIMQGLKRLEISASLPFLLLTPVVIAIAAYALLGETLSHRETAGILLMIAGGYMLQFTSFKDILAPIRYVMRHRAYAAIFGAMAIVAIAALLNRYVLVTARVKPLTFIALDHFFALANLTIAGLVMRRPLSRIIAAFRATPLIIPAVAGGTAAYRFFEVLATASAPVALVVSLKRLSVVFAVAIGGRLFREGHLPQRIIATLVMLAGAALVAGA
jgi:uncharacterized membrane protein